MAAAADVKQLLLQVDASVELLRRNLNAGQARVDQFATETQRRLDATDRRFGELGRPLSNINASVASARREIATLGSSVESAHGRITSAAGGIKAALLASASGIAAAFSADRVKDYADGYTRYTNQLKLAGLEGAQLSKVQNDLYDVAQRYGVELESVGTLFGRLSQGAKELGATQSDLIRFTNGVGAALKIQGGDAASSSGALLQLTQALGGTYVRAEEFNSINEGARPILQAVANGIDKYKGSVSALRADVIAGTLTSKDFFEGFLRGSAALEAQAAKANLTIGASFTILNNALGKYIGETDAGVGASARVSEAIVGIANNLDLIAPALAAVGAGFAARFVIGPVAAMAGEIALITRALDAEKLVLIGSKVAAAQKAAAVAAGAETEVAAIEATIAARKADQAALAQSLALIQAQRADALQAQRAIAENNRIGLGTVGVTRSLPDAARANQDLKALIVTRRALGATTAELTTLETALAAAQTRSAAATTAASAAAAEATIVSRAAVAASKLFAGALTLIGGSVAGGAAVLVIGALIAAVIAMRAAAAKTAEDLAAFAQHEREAADTSKLLAAYALSASSQVAKVGTSAAGATGQVRSFAGAVGDAAAKLENLARARRHELSVRAATDQINAKTDEAAARQRLLAASGAFNPDGVADQSAVAAAKRQIQAAQERGRQAQANINTIIHTPLTTYVTETDRPGGRDVAGDRARIARDLSIARQGGNRDQVRDLQAQQFEVNQYDKYRKSGLSVEAANAQASKDASDFRSAGDAKAAKADSAKAAREGATAQRREAAAAKDAAADARAYTSAERQANNDIAAARAELSGSAEERAALEKARIETDRQSRNAEIADQAKQGRYGDGTTGQARALELQRLNNERAALDTQVVDAREKQRAADEALSIAQAGRQNEQDLLQAQSNLATTASERRKIELRLLDLQYQEELARLDGVIASRDSSEAEKEIAKQRKAALGQIHALQVKGVEQQNAGPTAEYEQRIRKATGDIHDALDGVRADGLQELEDGLVGIVSGTESVSSAFKRMASSIIADLARIAIERAIVSAIGGSFFGIKLAAAGGKVEGKATGGRISGPGTGTSDSIPALIDGRKPLMVSNGESIITAAATARYWPIIDAMNRGRLPRYATGGVLGTPRLPSTIAPSLDTMSGTGSRLQRLAVDVHAKIEASEDFNVKMQGVAVRTVGAAAEPIMKGAKAETIRTLRRPSLPGGWG
ncbi:tape measure protein [Sphingomonas sp. H39-1-10]|uniref:tape measure protein n=1 Tax=Sphingomonas pollutisoli TaxID=3030829 RepID=UPI0023B9D2F9|nr:tape measure protein [Sphingomonas pollutisoli]MDF0489210.1 tape measure protein [Sphingomonas pollutisoli]